MKQIVILLILSVTVSFAQQEQKEHENSKTLEGYYDLSEFEMPARLFLLDNRSFHYSAIFGSVDLEIYGKYIIKENELRFHPDEDQMQPFILYGRKNKALKDSIAFNYYKPDEDYRYQVVFAADKQWIKSPLEEKKRHEVYFKVKQKRPKLLKIGYPALHIEVGNFLQVKETYAAEIPKGNNDFLLSYNRYYNMRKQFFKNPIQLKGDSMISGGKAKQKRLLAEGEREKMIAFLEKNEMFESIIESRGNIFKRIPLSSSTEKLKLQIKENGQLEEIPIDTIQKDGNGGENSSYDTEKIGNYNKKGEKTGEWRVYFGDGALALLENYKNGKLDGQQKAFYETGELKAIASLTNGTLLEWKQFYKSGQLEILVIPIAEKKQHWKYYYKDGTLKEEESINEEGERDGAYKAYYQNGKLSRSATFKDGKLIGEWKNNDEDGKLIVPEKK